MNRIKDFLNFFRILLKIIFLLFKNRQDDYIITQINYESEYILEEEIVQEPTNTIVIQRRCGYCREQGHTVTYCNNAEILNYRNELQQLIDGDASRNHITDWLNNKDDRLLKAIGCHYNILSFNRNYLRDVICRNIINYIAREQVLNSLSNRQNEPIHPSETFQQKCTRLEITRIKLEPHFTHITNRVEMFECPICFNNINDIDIAKTNCNHNFCNICIINTIKNNPIIKNYVNCPLCRTRVNILFTYD